MAIQAKSPPPPELKSIDEVAAVTEPPPGARAQSHISFMANRDFHIVTTPQQHGPRQDALAKRDAGTTPFKVVVDPKLRLDLRRALIDLIDYHDDALAENFSQGKLELESYKEYIELFARSLKETMESKEGISYLLRSVGFEVRPEEINMNPQLRWKKGPGGFGASLL
jgi:hypothetical protein